MYKKIQKLREYYSKPTFSPSEYNKYFSISETEEQVLHDILRESGKILFILQLGLFKKYQRFFELNEISSLNNSISYLYTSRFPPGDNIVIHASRPTLNKQKKLILKLLGYRLFSQGIISEIETYLKTEIQFTLDETLLLRKLIDYLVFNKIAFPIKPDQIESIIFRIVSNKISSLTSSFSRKLTKAYAIRIKQELSSRENIGLLKIYPANNTIREIRKEIKRKGILDNILSNELNACRHRAYAKILLNSTILQYARTSANSCLCA